MHVWIMHTWGEVPQVQSIRNGPSKSERYNTISLNMQICPVLSRQSQVHSVSPLSRTCRYWMEICLFSELFIFLHFTESRRRKWLRFLEALTNSKRDSRQWKLTHHKLTMSLFRLTSDQFFLPPGLDFVGWGVAGPADWQRDRVKVLRLLLNEAEGEDKR